MARLVENRTRELEESNKQLQLEIAELKRAEQEIKEAQAKLIQSERLAAVAQIVSEAAHEIRNPLSVIKTAAYLLKKILPQEQEKVQQTLCQIDRATDRAANYLTALLIRIKG